MTWRASRDWGQTLGYSNEQIAEPNRAGIAQAARSESMPVVIGFTVETDGRHIAAIGDAFIGRA